MAEERKEEHQKCEELKEETLEINGHCQEVGLASEVRTCIRRLFS